MEICALPLLYKYSKRNMILAGLWFSEEKPTMMSFLHPLLFEMNDLHNGMYVKCVNVHVITMDSCCDTMRAKYFTCSTAS